MPSLIFAARTGTLLAAAALVGTLTACAAEPTLTFTAPTMAPQQSIVDACGITGVEVERLSQEVQQQILSGVEQAGADLASGNLPSIDVLSGPLEGALTEIEAQVSNSEVLAAVTGMREAAQGFQDIVKPESALGVPGYIASLSAQANELTEASKQLQSLCSVAQ